MEHPAATVRFDHERLEVYQASIRFVAWTSDLLLAIEARAAARDQLDRASTSIPLNIAEGNGKRSPRDRARYFEIARGSALECAACLDVLVARRLLTETTAAEGKDQLAKIVSMIFGMIRHCEARVAEMPPSDALQHQDYDYEQEQD